MQASALVDRLLDAGLDPAERTRKTALFERVLGRWRATAPGPPAAAWFVPGRLEVFGTHTDYAGGRTLVAAVPRGFAFAMTPRHDGRIHIVDASTGEDGTIAPAAAAAAPAFKGWRHYVEVCAARLSRNFPDGSLGADIAFASDLPRAAGMSSSSALIVGVATSLIEAGGLRARPEWTRNIRSGIEEAGYLACIENGRTFGDLQGDAGVGTHGGSEDHAAMLAGVAGACRAFAFVPMRIIETVPVPPDWTIVVSSSGVGSHKTGSERDAYNRLSEGAAILLRQWNARFEPSPSLAVALESRGAAVDRLADEVRRAAVAGWTPEQLVARLHHFANEDRRVERAVAALRSRDAAAFGALARDSQDEAETLLRNQVPATSRLTAAARECGALAARSFGAGFGGSVWAAVTGDADEFRERWAERYRAAMPSAAVHAVNFVARPGPPLTRVG